MRLPALSTRMPIIPANRYARLQSNPPPDPPPARAWWRFAHIEILGDTMPVSHPHAMPHIAVRIKPCFPSHNGNKAHTFPRAREDSRRGRDTCALARCRSCECGCVEGHICRTCDVEDGGNGGEACARFVRRMKKGCSESDRLSLTSHAKHVEICM